MAILELLSYLNRNKDADLETARRIQEVNAQGSAQAAAQAALQQAITQETLLRAKDEERRQQQVLLDAFYREALKTGATGPVAFQMAQDKLAQYVGSKPTTDIATNNAAAIEAERKARMGIGALPGAVNLGRAITEANTKIAGQQGAEADLGTATANERFSVAPRAAATADVADIMKNAAMARGTSAMLPRAGEAAAAVQDLGINQTNFDISKLAQTSPTLAGQAANMENRAAIAKGGLTEETGGIVPSPLSLSPDIGSDYYDRFAQQLEAALARRRRTQSAPSPSALPSRLNLRDLE